MTDWYKERLDRIAAYLYERIWWRSDPYKFDYVFEYAQKHFRRTTAIEVGEAMETLVVRGLIQRTGIQPKKGGYEHYSYTLPPLMFIPPMSVNTQPVPRAKFDRRELYGKKSTCGRCGTKISGGRHNKSLRGHDKITCNEALVNKLMKD